MLSVTKGVVYSMYNNFDNGVGLMCLMNLKVLLGLKFGHDHTCYLGRNVGWIWFDLLNLLSLEF